MPAFDITVPGGRKFRVTGPQARLPRRLSHSRKCSTVRLTEPFPSPPVARASELDDGKS